MFDCCNFHLSQFLWLKVFAGHLPFPASEALEISVPRPSVQHELTLQSHSSVLRWILLDFCRRASPDMAAGMPSGVRVAANVSKASVSV